MSLDTEINRFIANPNSPPLTLEQVEVYKDLIQQYTQRTKQSLDWGTHIDRTLQESGCSAQTAFYYAFSRYQFAGVASR